MDNLQEESEKPLVKPSNVLLHFIFGSTNCPIISYINYIIGKKRQIDDKIRLIEYSSSSKQSIQSRLNSLFEAISEQDNENKNNHRFIFVYDPSEEENLEEESFRHLIRIFDSIIYVSLTEKRHFEHCVLNRINKTEILNELWPLFKQNSVRIINSIILENKTSILTIIDCDRFFSSNLTAFKRNDSMIEEIIDHLFDRNRKISHRLDVNATINRLKQDSILRDNNQVSRIVNSNKGPNWGDSNRFMKEWIDRYRRATNDSTKLDLIDKIMEIYESRHILNDETRSVLKNAITDSERQESICSILIQEAMKLSANLKINPNQDQPLLELFSESMENFQEEPNQRRVYTIAEMLDSITKHFIFKHRVFNDDNFIKLIKSMLLSKNLMINFKATSLLFTLLETDNKRYGSQIISFDKSDAQNPPIVRIMFDLLFKLTTLFCDNDSGTIQNSDEFNFEELKHCFLQFFNFKSIVLLLKGSYETCTMLTNEDIKKLVILTQRVKDILTKSRLYDILNTLFKYGSINSWRNNVNIKRLLSDIHENILALVSEGIYGIQWQRTTIFYRNLLKFLEKDGRDARNFEPDLESESKIQEELLKTKDESKETLKTLYSHYVRFEKNRLTYDVLFKAEKQKSISELTLQNQELNLQNIELSSKLTQLETQLADVREELKRISADRIERIRELESLRFSVDANPSQVIVKPSQDNHITKHVNDEPLIYDDDNNFMEDFIKNESEKTEKDCIEFINILRKKRENLKEFRKLICGSLKHLSINLYSSPMHYLSEIVQNFEDNEYGSESVGIIKLIIEGDYLLFCSDEKGFKAKDVKAICSCSESTKQKGKHIGNKGLGFKSVFLCSDNPVIISKPHWQFEFRSPAITDQDEISYMTPISVDRNNLGEGVRKQMDENDSFNTFFYLPIKETYKYKPNDKSTHKYFYDIIKNVNHNVLLFTNNIKRIILEDNLNKIKTSIQATKYSETTNGNVRYFDAVIKVEKPDNLVEYSWRIFKKNIKVDISSQVEENLTTDETEITIGFPSIQTSSCELETYPVFAFLPVCDVGFKFLINCNWSLVTSRENINEHSALNRTLRDELANLFVWVVNNDLDLQKIIHLYLPTHTSSMSDWWKLFIDDVRDKLGSSLDKIFMENLSKNRLKTRIFNEKLADLVDENNSAILDYGNIEIISRKNINLSQKDLDFYGINIKPFSIADLVDVFCIKNQSSEVSERFQKWKNELSKEWWEKFYRFLYLELRTIDLYRIKSSEIFLMRPMMNQNANIKARSSINKTDVCYFICESKAIYSWKTNLQIIDYESINEKKILTEYLHIPALTEEKMIEIILAEHSSNTCLIVENPYEIWQDLKFIKDNFDLYSKFSKDLSVKLPTINGRLVNPEYALIPSILNYDLTIFSKESDLLIDLIKFSKNLALREVLEWEEFFLKLGCLLPNIDRTRTQISIELRNNEIPPMNDLSVFDDPRMIQKALSILKLLENRQDFLNSFRNLPIKSKYGSDDIYIVPVANTCSQSLFKNILPCIDFPDYMSDLASCLGVTVEVDFQTCIKCLKQLVTNNEVNKNSYIDWFLSIRNHLDEKDENNYQDFKLIYLNNINQSNKNEYFKLSQIYCTPENDGVDDGLLIICEYLNKTVISTKYNSEFMEIRSTLVSLGCSTGPTFNDVIECIQKMAKDINLYNQRNYQSILSNQGYQKLKEVYYLLESMLSKHLKIHSYNSANMSLSERNDLSNRINEFLREKNIFSDSFMDSLKTLPIISYDRHLIDYSDKSQFRNFIVCFQIEFIDSMRHNFPYTFNFFDIKIAEQCPHIIGLLDIKYINSLFDLYLNHMNSNMEKTNKKLNQELIKLTGIKNLEILKSKYLALNLSIKEEVNDDTLDKRTISANNNLEYSVFNKSTILCTEPHGATDEYLIYVLGESVVKLVKSIDPNTSDIRVNEIRNSICQLRHLICYKSGWMQWEGASQPPTKYDICDVIFPDDKFDINKLSDIYHTGLTQALITDKNNKTRFVNPDYMADQENYLNRLETSDQNYLDSENKFEKQEYFKPLNYSVNTERQKKIGIKAEHFFSCYLKKHYGDSYNEFENWVSSARNYVYPSRSAYYDDSLGYDFFIDDFQNLFADRDNEVVHVRRCFIEVKGTEYNWDGTFHISKNEKDCRDKKASNREKESYIIAIIENVSDPDRIGIAKIIDWTKLPKAITLIEDSFVATFKKDESIQSNKQSNQPKINTNHNNVPRSNLSNQNQKQNRPRNDNQNYRTNNQDNWSRNNSSQNQNSRPSYASNNQNRVQNRASTNPNRDNIPWPGNQVYINTNYYAQQNYQGQNNNWNRQNNTNQR